MSGISTLLVYFAGIRWAGGSESTHDAISRVMSEAPAPPVSRPGIGAVFPVVAFTHVPALLGILLGIPFAGLVVLLGLAVWSLFVFFAGLGALGIATTRALVILVINWVLVTLLQSIGSLT